MSSRTITRFKEWNKKGKNASGKVKTPLELNISKGPTKFSKIFDEGPSELVKKPTRSSSRGAPEPPRGRLVGQKRSAPSGPSKEKMSKPTKKSRK